MNWELVSYRNPSGMGKGGVLEILLGMCRLLLGIPIDYSLLYGEL